jgi:hypothetical protein
MMAAEKVQVSMRMHGPTYRAVNEVAALNGRMSREDTLDQLLRRGLAVTYAELGIERDPAETAAELLAALAGAWGGELSDDELAAFGTVRAALDRIVQVRARDAAETSTP